MDPSILFGIKPQALYGFNSRLDMEKIKNDSFSVENRGNLKLMMHCNGKNFIIEKIPTKKITIDYMSNIEMTSGEWKNRCYAKLLCLDYRGILHVIATGNIFQSDKGGHIISFNRSFAPIAELNGNSFEKYIPIAVYIRCIENIYGSVLKKGRNIFITSEPNGNWAIINWSLSFTGQPKTLVWDVLVYLRNQILFVEELFAKRMVMIDSTNPSDISKSLITGNSFFEQEKFILRRLMDIEILSRIGSGGVGQLWLARNKSGTEFVVKVFSPDIRFKDYKNLLKRFKKEFKILKSLNGKGISPEAYDIGGFLGKNFYLQEHLKGFNLKKWLAEEQSVKDKCTVVYSLINVVEKLHENRVIHRDLSPKNIMVLGKETKLVDFGAATTLNNIEEFDITLPHEKFGSLKYTAPEVRENTKNFSEKSDLFSLGIIIYEVFLAKTIFGNIEPLNEINKKIPKDISDFAFNAISFNSKKRKNI